MLQLSGSEKGHQKYTSNNGSIKTVRTCFYYKEDRQKLNPKVAHSYEGLKSIWKEIVV